MNLVYKIDADGFYVEDIIYREEWSKPTSEEQNSDFTPTLLNPIDPSKGVVGIQPMGLYKPKWDFSDNMWVEGDTIAALDNVKQSKLRELKESYAEANFQDIAYMNTIFQADTESQNLIVSVLSAGSAPSDFFWLDVTNNQLAITYEELQGLSGTILARNHNNFIKYQGLKYTVKQTETLEEIGLIEW